MLEKDVDAAPRRYFCGVGQAEVDHGRRGEGREAHRIAAGATNEAVAAGRARRRYRCPAPPVRLSLPAPAGQDVVAPRHRSACHCRRRRSGSRCRLRYRCRPPPVAWAVVRPRLTEIRAGCRGIGSGVVAPRRRSDCRCRPPPVRTLSAPSAGQGRRCRCRRTGSRCRSGYPQPAPHRVLGRSGCSDRPSPPAVILRVGGGIRAVTAVEQVIARIAGQTVRCHSRQAGCRLPAPPERLSLPKPPDSVLSSVFPVRLSLPDAAGEVFPTLRRRSTPPLPVFCTPDTARDTVTAPDHVFVTDGIPVDPRRRGYRCPCRRGGCRCRPHHPRGSGPPPAIQLVVAAVAGERVVVRARRPGSPPRSRRPSRPAPVNWLAVWAMYTVTEPETEA